MRRNVSVLIFIVVEIIANLAAQSKPETPEFDVKEH
jgi:hypothetical protein